MTLTADDFWPPELMREILDRLAAQAIEARERQDAKTGLARKGESAVGKADAPTL